MELMSKETDKIFAALSSAQKVMKGASKDSTNPFFKSKYADLESCWDAGREPLCQNGLCIIQTMEPFGDEICLVTTLGHTSGQWIKSLLPMPIEKADPQTLGKSITYCRRYAYAAIIGLYQEDDDAESIMDRGTRSAQKPVSSEAPARQSAPRTSEGRMLSQKQLDYLSDLSAKVKDEEYLRNLANYFDVEKLSEVDPKNFNGVITSLRTKLGYKDSENGTSRVA